MKLVYLNKLLNIEDFINRELWTTVKYVTKQKYTIPTTVALKTNYSSLVGNFSCKIDSVFNILVRTNVTSKILDQEKFLFTVVDLKSNFHSSRLVVQELITKFDANLLVIVMSSNCFNSQLTPGIIVYVQTPDTIAFSFNQFFHSKDEIIVPQTINPLQKNNLVPSLYFTFNH